MPDGWAWSRLEPIASLITDYVANGSFASLKANVRTYKEKNYALFVRTVDFANNFKGDLSYIDKESYDFLEKSKLYGGELMLSNIGASVIFKGDDNSYYEKYGEKLPSGWVVTNFETILEYEQPTKYIVHDTNYKPTYKTPVLTAGKSFILGYTNETDNIFDDLPVIIFDDFTTESKFVDFSFKVKSSAMKILHINQDLVLPKYAFYLMQATEIDHDNHQRYWISTYSQEIVALPPINEQERILTALEHYFNLLDTLQ